MMPNPKPEDAFKDENAPPIPELEKESYGDQMRRQQKEREAAEAEAEEFEGDVDVRGVSDFKESRRLNQSRFGIVSDSSSGSGGEAVSVELLDELKSIRSLLESVLNS